MLKKLMILFFGIFLIGLATNVSAGNFNINNATGSRLFTVDTSGNTNATGWLAENGVRLSDTYLALSGGIITGGLNVGTAVNAGAGDINISGTYYGDGSALTGITVSDDSLQLDYHNLTSIPTCSAGTFLAFGGTDLTCESMPADSVTIAGENITSGTINEARLPSTIYTIGLNATLLNVGTIPTARIPTLDYHNITGIQTCTGTERLFYDGTDLTCVAVATADFTNVAYYNNTNTWAEDQIFSKDINMTGEGDIRLFGDNSAIVSNNSATTMSIDSSGNVIFTLSA